MKTNGLAVPVATRGTRGTGSERSAPKVTLDFDLNERFLTIQDAIATGNRIARANHEAIERLTMAAILAVVLIGAYHVQRGVGA